MTITGAVKFFGPNHVDETCTFSFTSANSNLSANLYDRNRTSKLQSSGSNDATNEDWVITFPSSKTFNRIWVDNHNIKSGNIQYWDGAAYQNFSTAATWSANADTTSYFEFDSVTCTQIRLRGTTTMVANDEKYVGELRVFTELGTPAINASTVDQQFIDKAVNSEKADGGNVFILFGRKYRARWKFTSASADDVTLFETLKTLNTPFFIWPCGGSGQNEYGYRLQDMFFVNYLGGFAPNLKGNLYGIGSNIEIEVAEV